MIKILFSNDNPHNGMRIFEALSKEGYKVASMDRVEMIWEHIENVRPELFLLDSEFEMASCNHESLF